MDSTASPWHRLADNTPILVGCAARSRREGDPAAAAEPISLMIEALALAEKDAGAPILHLAEQISVPRGFWSYSDPGRLLARAFGADRAATVLADIGILQQSLFSRACQSLAAGECEVAVIAGGEARHRVRQAAKMGVEASETVQNDAEPNLTLRPDAVFGPDLEAQRGLMMPVAGYALMENALRAERGCSIARHQSELAQLAVAMSEVAADNPLAWQRQAITEQQLLPDAPGNRLLAWPYTRLLTSQWNVDQASAFILCTVDRARKLGIDPECWIYPLSAAESNRMAALSLRPVLSRCAGAGLCWQHALELAELDASQVELLDIYSCFPAAVQIQAREMGLELPLTLPITVTGGMTFAGGPLNNYMLQSTARMVQLLRTGTASTGAVSCVSGLLHKQAIALWGRNPPARPFRVAEVGEMAARESGPLKILAADALGNARVVSYTVTADAGKAPAAVALCDLPDGRRTIAQSDAAGIMAMMMTEECVGIDVELQAGGRFSVSGSGAS